MPNLLTLVPQFDRSFLTIKNVRFDYGNLQYGKTLKSDKGLGYIIMDKNGILLLSGTLYTAYKDTHFEFPTEIKNKIKQVYIVDTQNSHTVTRFIGQADNFLAGLPELTTVDIMTSIDLQYADSLNGFLSNNPKLSHLMGLHHLIEDMHVSISRLLYNDPSLTSLLVGSGVHLCGSRSLNMFQKCLQLQSLSFGSRELSKVDRRTGVDVTAWISTSNHGYIGDGHVQGTIINPLAQSDVHTVKSSDDTADNYDDTFENTSQLENDDIDADIDTDTNNVDDTIEDDYDVPDDSSLPDLSAQSDFVGSDLLSPVSDDSNVNGQASSTANQDTTDKAKQEAELKAKQEAELKAKQEAELKAKQEAELKAKQEAELKANIDSAMNVYSDMASQANNASYTKSVQEFLNTASNNTNALEPLVNTYQSIQPEISDVSENLTTLIKDNPTIDGIQTMSSAVDRNNQYYQQAFAIADSQIPSISLAANTVHNRDLDLHSLAQQGSTVLSEASEAAIRGEDLTNHSNQLQAINSQGASMFDEASSAAAFSTDQFNHLSSAIGTFQDLAAWYDNQNAYAESLAASANSEMQGLTDDAQEYQDMVNSAAFSLRPQYSAMADTQSEVADGVDTVNAAQQYVNSLTSDLVTANKHNDDETVQSNVAQLQLVNAHINKVASEQASVAHSLADVKSQASQAKDYVDSVQSQVTTKMEDVKSVAADQDVDAIDSLTDELADFADTVQGEADQTEMQSQSMGKYVKLNQANVSTATTLREKADKYVALLTPDAGSAAAFDETMQSASSMNPDVVSEQVQTDSTQAPMDATQSSSAENTQSSNEQTNAKGEEYDDFDIQHHVAKDLWSVTTAVTLTTDDGQKVVLEPAMHPIFKLLAADVTGKDDTTNQNAFKLKIKYQDYTGTIDVLQNEITSAYYWHGSVMNIAHSIPFKLKILEMTQLHSNIDFKDADPDRLFLNDTVTVTGMEVYRGIPRFQLSDGRYITTNRYFVQVLPSDSSTGNNSSAAVTD